MAKILCGISGIEFSCDHLPIYLDSREYAHPVFFLPQRKLLGLFQKYRHAELNTIDSYLTFLAYLNSTDLVEWRVPAQFTARTEAVIANNFEHLVEVCSKINTIKNPSVRFAHVAVTPETKTLDNIQYWLLNWESSYTDFKSGYAAQRIRQDIAAIEEKLDILAADANRSEIHFASRLAEWADKAGSFPRFPVQISGQTMLCNEYWKLLIRKCVNPETIFTINARDLEELTEHCYSNIEAGSTYSYNLFKILKEGAARYDNFLGISGFSFSIISESSTIEQANRSVIIANAPDHKPNRLEYPSQFQYLKAKLAWEMAQESASSELIQKQEIAEELGQTAEEPEIDSSELDDATVEDLNQTDSDTSEDSDNFVGEL